MKRKLINAIIATLAVVLITASAFTYNIFHKTRQLAQTALLNNQITQTQEMKAIKADTIITKLNAVNSINCLAGEASISVNYSNDNISDQDVQMSWLKKVLKGKSMEVTSRVDFDFAYDLQNLPVTSRNNVVSIQLSYNRLSLLQCETCGIQTTDKTGLFTSFSPSEVTSLVLRTQGAARNTIQSYSEFRTRAMENTQNNIKALLEGIVDKNTTIVFNTSSYDAVAQDDATITNYTLK